jgi:hypothetical protein
MKQLIRKYEVMMQPPRETNYSILLHSDNCWSFVTRRGELCAEEYKVNSGDGKVDCEQELLKV